MDGDSYSDFILGNSNHFGLENYSARALVGVGFLSTFGGFNRT